ncbi:MAG: NapC/NirT family cytochrome c [Candidatus Aminicenantes bacterium]|nr:NapC/NirT family cytochrome c [Candidatus Aminicenantes bacterium]
MALPRYKKKFWLIVSLLILIVVLGAGTVSVYFVRYSATSTKVCNSCHPVVASLWKGSHGCPPEKTSCMECHSRGRKIIPDNWNILRHMRDQIAPPEYSADRELTSQRCLDCHEEVLDFGYEPIKKVIQFTHRYHIAEDLDCMDCHKNAGHEYMKDATNRPSIKECIQCHIKDFTGAPKSAKCLNCHDVMLVPGKEWD